MALAQQGESGYAAMLEHQTRMGDVLRDALRASGWRIVNSTPLPLVCFTREGLVPSNFLAALHQRQIAWMSEARVGGIPVVRACITSFNTTEEDIHWVVGEMNRLAAMEFATSTKDVEQYVTQAR
jgi:glutamate/tyrosine decarboxylase-like PLP-dependent enzyme